MAALHEEGAGQGPPKRPHVPGLIDAGLVPLQTLMHQCWHQVTTCFAHFQYTMTSSAHLCYLNGVDSLYTGPHTGSTQDSMH